MSNTKKEIYMSTNGYFSHELCDRLLADAATALEYREKHLSIKKVIFNCPATIVLWADGTKTVVKSGDYDVFDPEKGLSMAFAFQ